MAESSDPMTVQDSLAKKLQLLQTENNTLRHQREAFEGNISNYVKTIGELTDQLSALELKNKELAQVHFETTRKCRKLELDLQRGSQQYMSLYHLVHVDKGSNQRKVIRKQIQLNNQLNQIQYNGYSKMIMNLKQKLNQKNQIAINLNSQNTKLKETILQSTYEYQQTIAKLKEEVLVLKMIKPTQTQRDSVEEENYYESTASRAQFQCLQKELHILENQYSNLSRQLVDCKGQLSHYKQEAQWLKITFDNYSLNKEIDMDLSEIRNVLEENVMLKKRLDQEIYRFNILVKNNPSLLNQLQEVNLTSPIDDIQDKYENLQKVIKIQQKELCSLKTSISDLTKSRNSKEQELLKYKTTAVKTVDKLKNIITAYVPCINLYGYSDYGLEEEECKFVEDNGANIAKEYDKLSAELIQKNAQIKNLGQNLKKMKETVKKLESGLEEEKNKSNNLSEENKRIVTSLDSLTEQWNQWNQNNQQLRQEDSPHFQEVDNEYLASGRNQDLNQVSSSKLDAISSLVRTLQQDRVVLLQCIRTKDILIAEANAELNILRNSNKPKVFSLSQLSSFEGDKLHASIGRSEGDSSKNDQFLRLQVQEYNKLKNEISSMGELYQNEIYLLQEQNARKLNDLNLKHIKLMTDNYELRKKYQKLEKMYQESLERHSERSKKAESIHSQQLSGIDLQENLPKDEKNVITETTIQIINDLLKKYQKQFSRFTSLYESELIKTKELKNRGLEKEDQRKDRNFLEKKIKLIQDIIQQKDETIRLQEEELKEKDLIIQNEKDNFDKAEALYEQRLADLEVRLNQTNSELSILQSKGVQVLNSGASSEGVSSKSMSFILSAVAAKSEEISQLKESLSQEKDKNIQLTLLISDLESRIQDQYSELEIEEFRQFKKLVEDGDLADVLEKASDLLEARQQREAMQQ